ncbi:hypothetical protein L204_102876 [Cryptococcus depauperatus]
MTDNYIPTTPKEGTSTPLDDSLPGPTTKTEPHTPHHTGVPPYDEIPHVGHGDKMRREAGELFEVLKDERASEESNKEVRDGIRVYNMGRKSNLPKQVVMHP